MNPSELRMMWMSQYNADRLSLEDGASYFGHPSVGLSVMEDIMVNLPPVILPIWHLRLPQKKKLKVVH